MGTHPWGAFSPQWTPWRLPWAPCAAARHPWRWRALPTCIPRLNDAPHQRAGRRSVCGDRVCPWCAVALSLEIIVKMGVFKTRGVNYSRRTLSPRPTAAGPAAERRASGPTSARCFPDCSTGACAVHEPAPFSPPQTLKYASPRPRLCSQFRCYAGYF